MELDLSTYKVFIHPHTLKFKFKAGTSRGSYTEKKSWFIKVWRADNPEVFGLGECGPLPGLSPDDSENFQTDLQNSLNHSLDQLGENLTEAIIFDAIRKVDPKLPSVKFGLETALLDLKNGGQRKILACDFYQGHHPIPINGLIWMGEKDFMMQQVKDKIEDGFTCIKIKVGAIDHEEEMEVIRFIRNRFPVDDMTIRLDANGAYTKKNVFPILEAFSKYGIHSIEQPVRQGQPELMQKVCAQSPIPIALDEELIGKTDKEVLLDSIRPTYIILKPTLIGGIRETLDWIRVAEQRKTGWWMTSLLESNIGLNSIAQLASYLKVSMPQGLGTGQLYENNILSPLKVENGNIVYDPSEPWDLKIIN